MQDRRAVPVRHINLKCQSRTVSLSSEPTSCRLQKFFFELTANAAGSPLRNFQVVDCHNTNYAHCMADWISLDSDATAAA